MPVGSRSKTWATTCSMRFAWFKPNGSPNLSCRYFAASHETLIWARKSKKAKHTFNYDQMKYGDFPKDRLKGTGETDEERVGYRNTSA